MISYVKGPLINKSADMIVVEAGPVGLGIHVPVSVLEMLPAVGGDVKLYTYLQVREDDLSLYGFLNCQDLDMFKQLISVNGIGPKAALGILSTLTPDTLRLAILTADAKTIARAPGVGQKTAQRIILDLKDKVSAQDILTGVAGSAEEGALPFANKAAGEAAEALMALGYTNQEAAKAVKQVKVTEEMNAEDVLKASLKFLAFM